MNAAWLFLAVIAAVAAVHAALLWLDKRSTPQGEAAVWLCLQSLQPFMVGADHDVYGGPGGPGKGIPYRHRTLKTYKGTPTYEFSVWEECCMPIKGKRR